MEPRDNSNGKGTHSVGAVVSLTQSQRAQLFTIEHEVRELLGKLGKLRDAYLQNEGQLREAMLKKRQFYAQAASRLGELHGIDHKRESWDFNADEMTFTRVR